MSSIANALYGGGDEPDFSGSPSQSQPQPQSPDQSAQRPSIWRNVLVGALHGLASSGGARTFGEGLATGAAGEQAAQERDKANQRAQAVADAQEAMYHASTNAALLKLAQANPSSPEHAQEIADYNATQNDSMIKAGGAKVVASFDNIEDAQRAALAGNGRVGTFHDSDGDLKYGLLQFSTDKVPDKTDVKYIGADGTEQTMSVGPNTISYADLDDLNHKYLLNKIDSSYKAHLENVKSQNKIDVSDQTGQTAKNQAAANKSNAQAAPKATDSEWRPKVSTDEKKKAELAENIAFNAGEVAKLLIKRPDLVGAISGRFTNAEQMLGNNDPDIAAIGTHIHNIAMANSGVHGFRSQEGVTSYENQLLNNFKNGPRAIAGALKASTGSVQTFIDNARPDNYKTHSKQGGALKGMGQ